MKYTSLLLLVFIVNCKSEENKDKPEESKVVKKETNKKVAEKPTKMPIKEILLSGSGVGRLGPTSAFDLKTMQTAFPEFDVKKDEASSEGEAYTIFTVKDKDELLLVVQSDENEKKVKTITVKSARVKNEIGGNVGVSFQKLFPVKANARCRMGVEEMAETLFCDHPSDTRLQYLFSSTKKDMPDERRLSAIQWHSL